MIRLAPTNVDPVASLDTWPVNVDLGGKRFRIPALDAAQWLKILLAETLDLEDIFPGLAGPGVRLQINEMLIEGEISEKDLVDAIKEALEVASGRRWWITLRLCRVLRAFWEKVGGNLAAHGMHPAGVPLAHWLDGAYFVCVEAIAASQPKKLTEFTQMLTAPPPEEARKVDDVAEGNAFLAAMRQAGRM